MIVLYILLGLIALFWIILAMPLRIFLTYQPDNLIYRIKYGPFSLVDSTKPPKEKPEKTDLPEPETKKSTGGGSFILDFLGLSQISSIANAKASIAKVGIVGTISAVFSAIKDLFLRIGKLIKKGVFKKFDLQIIVGDSDAADAAMRYGQICAAAFPMLNFLENNMKLKKEQIDIRCDYEIEETQVSFDGQLNYRPWHFVCFALGLFGNYIKRSLKKEK